MLSWLTLTIILLVVSAETRYRGGFLEDIGDITLALALCCFMVATSITLSGIPGMELLSFVSGVCGAIFAIAAIIFAFGKLIEFVFDELDELREEK